MRELLSCGAEIHIVNLKRLMHVKSYGSKTSNGEMIVVTSGNFTGPGMAQNVEMAILLDHATTRSLRFSWDDMLDAMFAQRWDFYQPNLANTTFTGNRGKRYRLHIQSGIPDHNRPFVALITPSLNFSERCRFPPPSMGD